jgi:NADH-quinone oxidoreductase subunit G
MSVQRVIDLCPVGALLDKDFLFEQRVWLLTATATIDGYTASGDNLWADHHDGRVWRFRPRPNPQVNKWWTSDEIRYSWKHLHAPERLGSPMLKTESTMSKCNWSEAMDTTATKLRAIVESGKRLALMISPMLSCEDAYLLAKAVRAIDEKAIIVEGPVPVVGEDKSFPGGYTVYAEKAPNARGVRRVLEQSMGFGNIAKFADGGESLFADHADIGGVILTGNYPTDWASDALIESLGDRFVVLIDTLAGSLIGHADVVLPGAVWLEKAGTFENVNNQLQAFAQAVLPPETAKPEGQIGLDLLTALGVGEPSLFDAAAVRHEIGGALAETVHVPEISEVGASDMQYAEL